MRVAEQYIAAFGNLAKQGNTILLPTNTGDVTSMVSQVRLPAWVVGPAAYCTVILDSCLCLVE